MCTLNRLKFNFINRKKSKSAGNKKKLMNINWKNGVNEKKLIYKRVIEYSLKEINI
jgi:hypothetical protein